MNESRASSTGVQHRDVRLGFIAGGLLMTAPILCLWQMVSHDLRYGGPGAWTEFRLLPALADLGIGWVPFIFGTLLVGGSWWVRQRVIGVEKSRLPTPSDSN